jgi:hypothetical protein
MKTTVFALCFLCATGALGQSVGNVLSNEPQVIEPVSHPQHASQHPMATEQNLLETSGFTYEKGERPLWEFATVSTPVPLGDTARMFRKEHATAKKAQLVLND